MSLTVQRLIAGQQAADAGSRVCFPTVQSVYYNWQTVCTSSPEGNRQGWCGASGYMGMDNMTGRKPGSKTLAQKRFTMKNTSKEQGYNGLAQHRTGLSNPATPQVSFDEFASFDEHSFAEKPTPRTPESPEEESFRSLIKTHLPRHKASPALLQRIRSSVRHIEE